MTRRAALVTGGSSGIGRAVAAALVELDHDVTLVARDADRLAATRSELGVDRCHTAAADLTRPDGPRNALDAHLHRYGRLDVLVHIGGLRDVIVHNVNAVDARDLSNETWIPRLVWFAGWLVIAVVCLWVGGRVLLGYA